MTVLLVASTVTCSGDSITVPQPAVPPVLLLNPSSLTLSAVQGGDSVAQTVSIVTSDGAVQWTASSDASWLTLRPTSGTTPTTVTIVGRPSSLTAGMHTATITVVGAGASNSPLTIPVSFVVSPRLGVTPGTLTFTGSAGQPTIAAQSLAVALGGSASTAWSVAKSSDWITVSPTAGVGDGTISVGINATGLGAGSYQGSLTLTAVNAAGSPLVIPVAATLTAPRVTISAAANPAEGGSVTGGGQYTVGEAATLTATPATGFAFLSWTENGVVSAASPNYAFLVSGARSLVANFVSTAPSTFTVNASASPSAGGTVSGGGTFASGATATLTATPASGYVFSNWTEAGTVVSSTATFAFAVAGNRILVANFSVATPGVIYSITTNATPSSAGSATGAGTYAAGSTVTVVATPNAGFAFLHWLENGTPVSTDASYSFTASGDRTLTAVFASSSAPTATITTTSSPAAGGTTTGAGNFPIGTTVNVDATANPGYTFSGWTENGVSLTGATRYTFVADRSRQLVANFTATSPISLRVLSPVRLAAYGDTLPIDVRIVSSTYSVASMSAAVGSARTSLSAGTGDWLGSLNLAGMPRDTVDLVVTATDVNGNVGTTTQRFIHDRPPVVTVTSPNDYDVARPNFSYSATCADDDPAGCRSFVLRTESGRVIATGTSSLNGTASLSESDGNLVVLQFVATDSRGTTTTVQRSVYVESSTHLVAVGSAPGPVIDFASGRALYSRGVSGAPPLALRDLSSGSDQVIPTASDFTLTRGLVTSTGAILGGTDAGNKLSFHDWRNGVLSTSTGSPGSATAINSRANLDASGNYAIFGLGGVATATLFRRDLSTGSDVQIAAGVGNTSNSVAANGDVAFWAGRRVFRYRNGAVIALTSDDTTAISNVAPVTDGVNTVYRKQTCCVAHPQQGIAMSDGVTETVLAPLQATRAPTYDTDFSPYLAYDANAGWIAFLNADGAGIRQVWRRAPNGTITQVSQLGSDALIDALGSDGSVVFRSGAGRRYLAAAGGAPIDIGTWDGTVVWSAGSFYWLIGRTVWRIQ